MKQSIKIILYFFLMMNNINCQDKKHVYNNIAKNMNSDNIEKALIKQLKQGSTYNIDEPAAGLSKIQFDIQELDATMDISSKILNLEGYKVLSDESFNQKIKNIFGRIIDYKLQTKFLYVNFLDKCDKEFVMYNNNMIDYEGIYIDKHQKIISKFYYIPEIIDYQKKYPQLNHIENSKIIRKSGIDDIEIEINHWRDVPDLQEQRQFNQQLLIHRNKYLFNDNKASFAWLKANDEYFLESLVTTFGYTKDKDLLAWVMKRNENKAEDFINENLFVKNCKGELEIREGILTYIEETINQGNYAYFNTLYSFYISHDKKIWDQFSEKEQNKMLAYLANTFDYLVMKNKEISYQSNGGWTILGNVFYRYNREDDEKIWNKLVEKFEADKYYGLLHLKEVIYFAYNYESGSY